MIQLASDPTLSKTSFRPPQGQGKESNAGVKRGGPVGHAWPFPSRYAARPARKDGDAAASRDSGS